MIELIADIFGTCGMFLFLNAEIRQFLRIRRTKRLSGISLNAYKSKALAVCCTGTCFVLSGLYLSLTMIICEGIVIAPMLYWLWKDKKQIIKEEKEEERQMDMVAY